MLLLGSDVIIMPIDDARKLMRVHLVDSSKERLKRLQKLGILDVILELQNAVRTHDALFDSSLGVD